jgi:3-oxoacyl-[acyl-carrier protein] reductase
MGKNMSQPAQTTTRIAIITGASSGIGQASAERFLQQGWQVLSIARRPASVPGVHSIQLDLDSDDLGERLKEVLKTSLVPLLGEPTAQMALIHNAGVFMNDTVPEIKVEHLWRTLQTNVVAPAILNREVLPYMAPGSSIIYVGSTLSEKAVANTASYVVSKHAVVGLMRATCQDLRGRKIHTACVCPGFVDTPMLRQRADAATMAALARLTAYEKVLSADDVAELLFQTVNLPVLNGSVIHAHYGQLEH